MTLSTRTTAVRRWFEVVTYGLAGALAFYLLAPLGKAVQTSVHPLPATYRAWDLAPWLVWLTAGVGLVVLGFLLAAPLGFHRASFKAFRSHPPTGVAIVLALGLVGLLGTRPGSTGLTAQLGAPTTAAGVLLLAIGVALGRFRGRGNEAGKTTKGVPPDNTLATQDFPWPFLEQWASRESDEQCWDLFARGPIVRRIASRLSSPGGVGRDIALLGAYGVGKTTIMRLVEVELSGGSPEERPAFCWVSCWGLERGANPAAHVLGELIRAIDTEIPGAGLSRVPAYYRRLLSTTNTALGTLLETALDWIDPPGDLDGLIIRLNRPLAEHGRRLILVLEDLDRDGDFVDVAQIQRLLWLLRAASQVSVVVAFDPQRLPGFDFARVCDHIELLRPIEADDVRRVMGALQRHCVQDLTWIDPEPESTKQDRLDISGASGELHVFARRVGGHSLANHIASVLKTPRNLRAVVDRVARAWDRLAGEVNWADLVVLTVLRVGSPRTYEFLVANRYRIRHREDRRLLSEGAEQAEGKAFRDHLGHVDAPDAVAELVDSLHLAALQSDNKRPPLQGVGRLEPNDYFERAVTEEFDGAIRDQQVLTDLEAWRRRDDARVFERLFGAGEEEYARLLEHFLDPDDAARVQEIVARGIGRLLERDGVSATAEQPGLMALWRFCNRTVPHSPETSEWLSELISRAARKSLPLANELYYYWASVRYGVVDEDGRRRVRKTLIDAAQAMCAVQGGLLGVLDPMRPFALRQLVWPDDREEPQSIHTQAQSWAWLGDYLLAEMAKGGESLQEPVRYLVWRRDRGAIDKVSAEAIFAADVHSLLRWLSGAPATDEESRQLAQAATEWLAER